MDPASDQEICKWELKYNRKRQFTDQIVSLFYSLKQNRNDLQCKVKELENNNEHARQELCTSKAEIEEKNCVIEKLTTDLKCKEKELCNLRGQLNIACNRSRRTAELSGVRSHSRQVEDKFKLERELYTKFKTVCEKLCETKIEFNEATGMINNDVLNIQNTVTALSKLIENNRQSKMTAEVQKLKEKNHIKDKKLCDMDERIRELQKETECNVLMINKQKKQLQELRDKWKHDRDCNNCSEKKCYCSRRSLTSKSANSI